MLEKIKIEYEKLGLFYGEDKTVATCHQGYQEEINQIAGLLEIDKLEEEWSVLQGMLSGSSKKCNCLQCAKELSGQTIRFSGFLSYEHVPLHFVFLLQVLSVRKV